MQMLLQNGGWIGEQRPLSRSTLIAGGVWGMRRCLVAANAGKAALRTTAAASAILILLNILSSRLSFAT